MHIGRVYFGSVYIVNIIYLINLFTNYNCLQMLLADLFLGSGRRFHLNSSLMK